MCNTPRSETQHTHKRHTFAQTFMISDAQHKQTITNHKDQGTEEYRSGKARRNTREQVKRWPNTPTETLRL